MVEHGDRWLRATVSGSWAWLGWLHQVSGKNAETFRDWSALCHKPSHLASPNYAAHHARSVATVARLLRALPTSLPILNTIKSEKSPSRLSLQYTYPLPTNLRYLHSFHKYINPQRYFSLFQNFSPSQPPLRNSRVKNQYRSRIVAVQNNLHRDSDTHIIITRAYILIPT